MSRSTALRRLAALVRKEWLQMKRDPSAFAVALGLPLLLVLIFGYGLSMDLRNVPAAVVLGDAGPTAEAVARRFRASPYFRARIVPTRAEAEAAQNARRDAAAAALQQKSIFFDFDSYAVQATYLPVIEAHARNLITNSGAHVVIEGNTDSRGSREYNLALGQKRSEAVKQRMQLLGVPASRIEAVSFGREKPVAVGENEAAWAQNRRADIVYR